ncbi:hypothetical protein PTKIN_Ptkin08bG0085700 [Pterospermum kingtungense]
MLFLILSSMLSMSSQARFLHREKGIQTHENSESQFLLHKLGFDLHQLKRYQKLSTRGANSDRVSPGGPDPQHHF